MSLSSFMELLQYVGQMWDVPLCKSIAEAADAVELSHLLNSLHRGLCISRAFEFRGAAEGLSAIVSVPLLMVPVQLPPAGLRRITVPVGTNEPFIE